MDVSVFLAKLLSIYLLVIGTALILNPRYYISAIADVINKPGLSVISSILALIIGLLIVLTNQSWTFNWRTVITLIGWLSLFKGLIRTIAPDTANNITIKFTQNMTIYYASAVTCILIGFLLLFCGFIIN